MKNNRNICKVNLIFKTNGDDLNKCFIKNNIKYCWKKKELKRIKVGQLWTGVNCEFAMHGSSFGPAYPLTCYISHQTFLHWTVNFRLFPATNKLTRTLISNPMQNSHVCIIIFLVKTIYSWIALNLSSLMLYHHISSIYSVRNNTTAYLQLIHAIYKQKLTTTFLTTQLTFPLSFL